MALRLALGAALAAFAIALPGRLPGQRAPGHAGPGESEREWIEIRNTDLRLTDQVTLRCH